MDASLNPVVIYRVKKELALRHGSLIVYKLVTKEDVSTSSCRCPWPF
jgi:hypothetical protein